MKAIIVKMYEMKIMKIERIEKWRGIEAAAGQQASPDIYTK